MIRADALDAKGIVRRQRRTGERRIEFPPRDIHGCLCRAVVEAHAQPARLPLAATILDSTTLLATR